MIMTTSMMSVSREEHGGVELDRTGDRSSEE